jgi:putative transposase
VTRLCRLFGVTRPGYYAWRQRPLSAHARQDRVLLDEMRVIFERSGGTYGSPRLYQALTGRGYRVSHRRVERLMRAAGWRARASRIYRRTAGTHRWFAQHPNRVQQRTTTGCDQIWVGDLTYVSVAGRWWYLAAVLDRHSRRLLAWRLGQTRDARFTGGLLAAALRRRRPAPGLIFHTDRGSEFLSTAIHARLVALGAVQSMTRGGAPDENAHMESFFHSLKAELLHGRTFATARELRARLTRYAQYYNQRRLHSALGYQSPVDYERGAA